MESLNAASENMERGGPAFIMVRAANASAPGPWQASVPLERDDLEEVLHDGSIFLVPHRPDDRECRQVTAVNHLTGARDTAVIIELGSAHA